MKKLPGTAASFTAAWGFWGRGVCRLYAYTAFNTIKRYSCQGNSFRDTLRSWLRPRSAGILVNPLSFRVPLSQVEEIDEAVVRERRKRRSDLLEAVWHVAWANYQRSGSLESYAERAAHLETQQARFRGLAGATVHGAGNDSGAGAFRVDRGSGAQADAVGGQVRRGKIGSDAAKAPRA